MSTDLIEIDGSFGEGGGQILRTSLALSLLTGKAFHLRHVRARRSKPGLQPQHLKSVEAAAAIGQARTRGASLRSTDLTFEPGDVCPGNHRFDIGTAGSTGLVLHTIYLPLALRAGVPCELTLTGGTHVSTSPSYHFNEITWRAYLAALGLQVRLRMDRPGFYPRGGGVVRAVIQPCARLHGLALPSAELPQRPQVSVSGISAVAGLDRSIARRQARRARHRLEEANLAVEIDEQTWDGGPGTVLVLELDTRPVPTVFVGLGARGKPAETVADEVVDEVLRYLAIEPGHVDAHSGDQLVLPLSLADGPSEYAVAEVTLHLTTNIAVIGHFLSRQIRCEGEEGGPGRVFVS
jgi:RNA 3'-terminal phosphate cyclase (ATP)